jgi:hypothetical protein
MKSRLLDWKIPAVVLLSLQCGLVSAQQDAEGLSEPMKQLSRETVISVKAADGKEKATLIPTAVFRYSDTERKIVDATLWAWVHNDRLVALQKIEATNAFINNPRWTYCFSSFNSAPLEVRWPNGETFATKGTEVKFHDVPDAPAPAEQPFQRLQQMKQMAGRFTGTISNTPDGSKPNNLRMFPKPVFLYPERPQVPKLEVFGLSAFGTNPDVYLLLQTERDSDGEKWTYAVRRMTNGGVKMKLDDNTVWEEAHIAAMGATVEEEGWKFFHASRKAD